MHSSIAAATRGIPPRSPGRFRWFGASVCWQCPWSVCVYDTIACWCIEQQPSWVAQKCVGAPCMGPCICMLTGCARSRAAAMRPLLGDSADMCIRLPGQSLRMGVCSAIACTEQQPHWVVRQCSEALGMLITGCAPQAPQALLQRAAVLDGTLIGAVGARALRCYCMIV